MQKTTKSVWLHLLRNAEYLNELDTEQNWLRRLIQLIRHTIELRKCGDITQRKTKILRAKMRKLLGESLTHLDDEFENFKKCIFRVKDNLFTSCPIHLFFMTTMQANGA